MTEGQAARKGAKPPSWGSTMGRAKYMLNSACQWRGSARGEIERLKAIYPDKLSIDAATDVNTPDKALTAVATDATGFNSALPSSSDTITQARGWPQLEAITACA